MFLKLRKGLYLLLGVGSVGGAFFAFMGLFPTLFLFLAGITHREWLAAATVLPYLLACAAGTGGPVWILLTVIALPDPSPKERRLLSALLAAAVLAAGAVSLLMLMNRDGSRPDIETTVALFLMPMLVGLALLVELWLPAWRAGRRPG